MQPCILDLGQPVLLPGGKKRHQMGQQRRWQTIQRQHTTVEGTTQQTVHPCIGIASHHHPGRPLATGQRIVPGGQIPPIHQAVAKNTAPSTGTKGEDLRTALGHLVITTLLGRTAPPVTARETLPAVSFQLRPAIGIHGRPLLAIGEPIQGALLLRPLQIGALHGDELVEIDPVYTARHHIADILLPHGIILTGQTKDEIRHDHSRIIPGQLTQTGQQRLPVIETGRLLTHPGIKALHPEGEAVEAPRQRHLPFLIIKAVEAPLQCHLGIRRQRKTADHGSQHGQLVGAHVSRRTAPHIDG